VSALVTDASIAIKWLIAESDTPEALALRGGKRFLAPDLLLVQAMQILWKKVRRRELSPQEAQIAARLLQGLDIELVPTRPLVDSAMRLSLELRHPPYDCVYLALALASKHQLVTADSVLLDKLARQDQEALRGAALSLADAARTMRA
jgi:predicted nucleic acid-binding protein